MKVDLSKIDQTQFMVHQHVLNVSKHKGQYTFHVHGTTNNFVFSNELELNSFKDLYLKTLDDSCKNTETWDTSFLFIMDRNNNSDWILIGAVNNEDNSLYPQDVLNAFAKFSGLKRPHNY
jgi:hypothetical protein